MKLIDFHLKNMENYVFPACKVMISVIVLILLKIVVDNDQIDSL